MADDNETHPNASGARKLLDVLNECKEVIALLVFFLGGVWWIQDRFPTKTDLQSRLALIKCELDDYMQLTQLQVRHEQLSGQLAQLDQQLGSATTVRTSVALSPSLQQMLSGLQTQRGQLQIQADAASAAMQKLNDDLARNLCAKETL
jgi:hypothetical protein